MPPFFIAVLIALQFLIYCAARALQCLAVRVLPGTRG